MGDADVAQNQNMLPTNDELEALLDEALMEVDEEMDRLLSYMNFLHSRTSVTMSLMSSLQKFQHCFVALNFFVIPIILAIGIAYGTAGWVTAGSTIEARLETLIKILMYVSGSIGLPLYVFALWDAYFTKDTKEESFAQRERRNDSYLGIRNESELTLETLQESLDTISQFRAFSRVRLRNINSLSRLDRSSEEEQVREDSEESTEFSIASDEMPAVFNNNHIKMAQQRIIDLDSDDSMTVTDSDTSLSDTPAKQKYEIGCQDDPPGDLEKNDDVLETAKDAVRSEAEESKLLKTDTNWSRGVRTIAIETVGEGDSSPTSQPIFI